MSGAGAAAQSDGYGGFVLGALQLGLPMGSLREVLRCGEFTPLPCPAACVLGGVNLRGVVVPVVDLRILLDRPREPLQYPCVIIMTHEGRLLGLLAERVTGVFWGGPERFRSLRAAEGAMTVAAGSVFREDAGVHVIVLSPSLLVQLAQAPLADDSTSPGSAVLAQAGNAAFDERSMPLMLVRCRRIAMGIDAMAVHSTLAGPDIAPSTLAVGACRGTIEYMGRRIPAVDLLELCGFEPLDISGAIHAFILQLDAGFVAFLVDEVIDVIRTRADDVVPLASYALPEPAMFAGTLPAARVSAVFTAPADRNEFAVSQYLLIDIGHLKSCALIHALAATNVDLAHPAGSGGVAERAAFSAGAGSDGRTRLVVFEAQGEAATPLEQIVEILPYHPESAIFGGAGALTGLMVNRGRSIPLFCLRRLSNEEPASATVDSRVLVVQCDTECVGFIVQRVKSIEMSSWNPRLPAHGERRNDAADPSRSRSLALVGAGPSERMVRVVDLERAAAALRGPMAAAAAQSTTAA